MSRALSRRRLLGGALALPPALAAFGPAREPVVTAIRDLRAGRRPDKSDYLLDERIRYLNHASIGTVPRVVHEAQTGYLRACESNPWLHVWGDGFAEGYAETRRLAAEFCGVPERNLAITRGTTEAFNVFAQGIPLGVGDEVIWSGLNHAGARVCFEHQAEARGFSTRSFDLPIDEIRDFTVEQFVDAHIAALSDRTKVLVIPHVDNVIGVLHPVRQIAEAARKRGVRFVLVDGAQTVGAMPLDLDGLGCDAYATSAHKWIQSPKGLGLAYVSDTLLEVLRPMVVTWGKQMWSGTARSLEDYGTRDYATILSLGDALRVADARDPASAARDLAALQTAAFAFVESEPRLSWASPVEVRLRGTLWSVKRPGSSSPELATRLFEEHGIVVRGHRGEHDCLRFSPGYATTEAEVIESLKILAML